MSLLCYAVPLSWKSNRRHLDNSRTKLVKIAEDLPRRKDFGSNSKRRHELVATSGSTGRVMRFRPCIDIHEGRVKQIVGSSLSADGSRAATVNFDSDKPAAFFADLYRRCNLPGGHIILLGGDRTASERAALQALAAYPQGLQIGGGITTDNACKYLEAGASHVIVTSFVFHEGRLDEERLLRLVRLVGKDRLVLDLSCRAIIAGGEKQYYVHTDRWTRRSDLLLSSEMLRWLSSYCAEFLVHAVDVEGKQCGIDEELVQLLAFGAPVPATYAGGVRNLEDLGRVQHLGRGQVDVTVGSALDIFGGHLPFESIVRWQRELEQGIVR